MTSNLDRLLALVRAPDSAANEDAIESARDRVGPKDLAALAASYPALDWKQRRKLVLLVQDFLDESTLPMLRDYLLHAPDGGEMVHEARAIALCHLEGDLDAFMMYLEDPAALAAKRSQLA